MQSQNLNLECEPKIDSSLVRHFEKCSKTSSSTPLPQPPLQLFLSVPMPFVTERLPLCHYLAHLTQSSEKVKKQLPASRGNRRNNQSEKATFTAWQYQGCPEKTSSGKQSKCTWELKAVARVGDSRVTEMCGIAPAAVIGILDGMSELDMANSPSAHSPPPTRAPWSNKVLIHLLKDVKELLNDFPGLDR